MTFSIPKFWAAKPKAEPQQEAIPILYLGEKDMLRFLQIMQAIDAGLQGVLNAVPITTSAGKIIAVTLVADHEIETFIQALRAVNPPATPTAPAAPTA